ncbi:MAG: TrmH family RNA methyltransferase [Metallibacterium sp.]
MPMSPSDPRRSAPQAAARAAEQRMVGLNACRAAFARRPQDLRKLWLTVERQRELRPMLAWCVRQRIGYRVVAAEEIAKLSGSDHHEGVCCAFLRAPVLNLDALLRDLRAGPALLLWLEGVGNPHNLGALLRSSAHFAVAGVLLAPGSELTLSPAALRIAEGGAEAVPVLRLEHRESALAQLHGAGFALAATTPHRAQSVYAAKLPARMLLWLGAEGAGLPGALQEAADLRLHIPGSGAVESLNVSAAAAVLCSEWYRRHVAVAPA